MSLIHISNGRIDEISSERENTLVTVTYRGMTGGPNSRRNEQTVRLVVSPRTIILNTNGVPVPASALNTGMIINAFISPAMTRSIPPQTTAFEVRVL